MWELTSITVPIKKWKLTKRPCLVNLDHHNSTICGDSESEPGAHTTADHRDPVLYPNPSKYGCMVHIQSCKVSVCSSNMIAQRTWTLRKHFSGNHNVVPIQNPMLILDMALL